MLHNLFIPEAGPLLRVTSWDKICHLTRFHLTSLWKNSNSTSTYQLPILLSFNSYLLIANKFWNEHRIRTLLVKDDWKIVPLMSRTAIFSLVWLSTQNPIDVHITGFGYSCMLIRGEQIRGPWIPISTVAKLDVEPFPTCTFESHKVDASYFRSGRGHRLPGCNYKGVKSMTQWCNAYSPITFSLVLRGLCALENSWRNFSKVKRMNECYSKSKVTVHHFGWRRLISRITIIAANAQRFAISAVLILHGWLELFSRWRLQTTLAPERQSISIIHLRSQNYSESWKIKY